MLLSSRRRHQKAERDRSLHRTSWPGGARPHVAKCFHFQSSAVSEQQCRHTVQQSAVCDANGTRALRAGKGTAAIHLGAWHQDRRPFGKCVVPNLQFKRCSYSVALKWKEATAAAAKRAHAE
jgi:hypothetical protein